MVDPALSSSSSHHNTVAEVAMQGDVWSSAHLAANLPAPCWLSSQTGRRKIWYKYIDDKKAKQSNQALTSSHHPDKYRTKCGLVVVPFSFFLVLKALCTTSEASDMYNHCWWLYYCGYSRPRVDAMEQIDDPLRSSYGIVHKPVCKCKFPAF